MPRASCLVLHDFVHAACEIAREVGEFQREELAKPRQVEFKGEINIVTEIDKKSEEQIIRFLRGRFPTHDIVAEEGGGRKTESEWCWYVDPLDGTTNYTHRYPLFAVSLALVHKGKVMVGVVYDPNRDELFVAEKGGGVVLNDKPIRVSQTSRLKESLLATGFAYDRPRMEENLKYFSALLFQAQALRRDGVASTDLCYVACGRFEAFWELGLFSWDVAAGSLIIQEAGGMVSMLDGSRLQLEGRQVLATNGKIHQEMLKYF